MIIDLDETKPLVSETGSLVSETGSLVSECIQKLDSECCNHLSFEAQQKLRQKVVGTNLICLNGSFYSIYHPEAMNYIHQLNQLYPKNYENSEIEEELESEKDIEPDNEENYESDFEEENHILETGSMVSGTADSLSETKPSQTGLYCGDTIDQVQHGYGSLYYDNGDEYKGSFMNGVPHGTGLKTYISGQSYEGSWYHGVYHGYGVLKYTDGSLYSGMFENNMKHGPGRFQKSNGDLYCGEFLDNLENGYGEIFYQDDRMYRGHMLNGLPHGSGHWTIKDIVYSVICDQGRWLDQGSCLSPDGVLYQGQWNHGMPHGHGCQTWSNGTTIEGTWDHGSIVGSVQLTNSVGDQYIGPVVYRECLVAPQGYGRINYHNGRTYEGKVGTSKSGEIYEGCELHNDLGDCYRGQVLNNQPHGPGYLQDSSGNLFKGTWDHGQMTGSFYIKYINDGSIYEGEVDQDRLPHGYGRQVNNQETYDGAWDHGKPHGPMTYTTPAGDRLVGQFHQGKIQGLGVYTTMDGIEYSGNFKESTTDESWLGSVVFPDGSHFVGPCVLYVGSDNNIIVHPHGSGQLTSKEGSSQTVEFVHGMKQENVSTPTPTNQSLVLDNGITYKGEVKDNKPHGQGIKTWPNGQVYTGSFQNGLAHGWGQLTHPKGWIAFCQWNKDQKHGKGMYIDEDGEVYQGSYHENQRLQGVLHFNNGSHESCLQLSLPFKKQYGVAYPNGSVYTGGFKNGCLEGLGRMVYPDNRVYEGLFHDNKAQGQGTFTDKDGTKYIGEFNRGVLVENKYQVHYTNGNIYKGNVDTKNHLPTGHGTMEYPYDESYIGEFLNGEYHGQGILKTGSTVVYNGMFRHGTFHGLGRETCVETSSTYDTLDLNHKSMESPIYPPGTIYEGLFLDGAMHGCGKLTLPTGQVYEGNFVNNQRHGQGTLTLSNGEQYTGEFDQGQLQGQCQLKSADDIIVSGVFQDNQFIPDAPKIDLVSETKDLVSEHKLESPKSTEFEHILA